MRVISLCTGYEGIGLGLESLFDVNLVAVADNDKGASKLLKHRYPDVPNLGDLSKVTWYDGKIDLITAGFPCQDVSAAGARAGLRTGTRSGLWYQIARAIGALNPRLVIIENARGLLSAGADSGVEWCPYCLGDGSDVHALRALGAVLGDLSDLGYVGRYRVVSAADAGAPHLRERVFITAWPSADTVGGKFQRRGIPGILGSTPAGEPRQRDQRQRPGNPAVDSGENAADTQRQGLERGTGCGPDGTRRTRSEPAPDGSPDQQWGIYADAVTRWESVLGRPAPRPDEPTGRGGNLRLSPAFEEWMMGLPEGWVTQVPGLTRTEQMKLLGNGCVPQQVTLAVRQLLGIRDLEACGVV